METVLFTLVLIARIFIVTPAAVITVPTAVNAVALRNVAVIPPVTQQNASNANDKVITKDSTIPTPAVAVKNSTSNVAVIPPVTQQNASNPFVKVVTPNATVQTAVFDLTPEHPVIRFIINPITEDIQVQQFGVGPGQQQPNDFCGCQKDAKYQSCLEINKARNGSAPSGEYQIYVPRLRKKITVYCEMGLNGGGYTFINPFNLPCLTDADIQPIFTDRSSFLLRARLADGSQPYGILQQLSKIPLQLLLSGYTNYTQPVNVAALGGPYMFYGFIPSNVANAINTVQGLKVNGVSATFVNCDSNPNSYISLFPNFGEKTPSTYGNTWAQFPMAAQIISLLKPVPSRRVMPESYFMFLEMHQGGCGMYAQTDGGASLAGLQSVSIGFR